MSPQVPTLLKSLASTAEFAAKDRMLRLFSALSKIRGTHCLTREATIALCKSLEAPYYAGEPTTFELGGQIQSLEVMRSGIVRLNRSECLYTDFGNRAALLDFRRPKRQVGHAIALWSHDWLGFYHFLAEVCPKICRLQEAFGPDFGGAKLCYPVIHRRYERELLGMLGVSPDSIIDTKACGGVVAERLTFVPMDGWFGTPPNIPLLRKRLMPPSQGKSAERLYLRRFGQRQCLQEGQMVPELEHRGFMMVDESSRSIVEQIHLFRDARVIVGPHGSAFTNMIWADPGARVVEMVPSTFDVPYHASLSRACGHHYTKIPCPNGPTARSGVSIHFNVDPEHVLCEVDRVLEEAW